MKQVVPEKIQERVFNVILKRPDNIDCADCSAKGPTWVSLDFGVFICMDCAGAHRTLGPTVSRVRSTKLDSWYQENIDLMENIGNGPANSYWENQITRTIKYYKLPSQFQFRKPQTNAGLDSLIRFVQDKYIKKLFIPTGSVLDPKSFYLKTKQPLKPFYFSDAISNASDTQQLSQTESNQKATLGDLLDIDEKDEFHDFQHHPPTTQQQNNNLMNLINYPNQQQQQQQQQQTNISIKGSSQPTSANTFSPEKKPIISQQHHFPSTGSLPHLDIMNLYNTPHLVSSVSYQDNSQSSQQNRYAYLNQMGQQNRFSSQQNEQHNPQPNYQQNQYQMYVQPQQQQQQQQQQQMYVQKPQGPIDIMALYGGKQQ